MTIVFSWCIFDRVESICRLKSAVYDTMEETVCGCAREVGIPYYEIEPEGM